MVKLKVRTCLILLFRETCKTPVLLPKPEQAEGDEVALCGTALHCVDLLLGVDKFTSIKQWPFKKMSGLENKHRGHLYKCPMPAPTNQNVLEQIRLI